MNANDLPVLSIFEPKVRLEVPLFQRQYVWSREQQWEPLWEDIARKFSEHLDGRLDSPVHFLGAMVLDQKMTPTGHVVRRQVIDGQQRLTTLQIFLAAFRDFCKEQRCDELAAECRKYTLNTGMMADPSVDRFKVWPTSADRAQFNDVLTSESRSELEKKHPLIRRKHARRDEPRPRMVEAYIFFFDQLSQFFLEEAEAGFPVESIPLALRLEECFSALKGALQVVVIDLGPHDDPQVIFETLNARGEPLLPADLLRNYIFLRAGKQGENQEALYEQYWVGFDEDFWREEVRQGRLNRPRSDLFMQHFLASRLTTDISAKHLYVEYRHWIETQQPFASIRDELETLAEQREHFRRIIAPDRVDNLYPLATFLNTFEMSTVYPFILTLLDLGTSDEELGAISTHLESYLLRRAICGLTNKNYNRTFLSLTKAARVSGMTNTDLVRHLTSLGSESSEWPSDERFASAWRSVDIYHLMNSSRLGHIFRRLNDQIMSNKNEDIVLSGPLTIEHLMPQSWLANWPLQDGSIGMTWQELSESDPENSRAIANERRNNLIHTIGNLTVLAQPLNSSTSNSSWTTKRVEIQKHSLLPINAALQDEAVWEEHTILRRADHLFEKALNIWPKPSYS